MCNVNWPAGIQAFSRIWLACVLAWPVAHAVAASTAVAELDTPIRRNDATGKGTLAVLYPNNVSEQYRNVFNKIIEGIEERVKKRVKSYPIDGEKIDTLELNSQLRRNETKVVIALGRIGIKAATSIDREIPVVVGGVLNLTDADQQNLSGTTLNPDPAILFARLKTLLPDTRRVLVVYNPAQNDALIKHAREAAKSLGMELQAFEARDLAGAAKIYETLFVNSDKTHDALWLPNDATTVEENTILPLVLKEAWNTSLPFFSSSLLHVRRGALFALYPNNLELGRTLASNALGVMAGSPYKKGVQLLREVNMAINLRTASHIGLRIDPQQHFDFVFPEP